MLACKATQVKPRKRHAVLFVVVVFDDVVHCPKHFLLLPAS
jgi:hypothetical protein